MVSKVFEKLVNNRIFNHLEKCSLFLISSMFLGLLDQQQIFWQLCLIELKCDHASDLWQQLELASELEFYLRDTVDWGKKWFVDFNAGKTQLVSFDLYSNTGAIDVKMDGSALEEK